MPGRLGRGEVQGGARYEEQGTESRRCCCALLLHSAAALGCWQWCCSPALGLCWCYCPRHSRAVPLPLAVSPVLAVSCFLLLLRVHTPSCTIPDWSSCIALCSLPLPCLVIGVCRSQPRAPHPRSHGPPMSMDPPSRRKKPGPPRRVLWNAQSPSWFCLCGPGVLMDGRTIELDVQKCLRVVSWSFKEVHCD